MKQQYIQNRITTGIWKYKNFFPDIENKYLISLNEGNTKVSEKEGIYFKHEYENPTGSVKDRGICFQIASVIAQGVKKVCISSSGNAAISASRYCTIAGIDLVVFVSPKINSTKMDLLKKEHCRVIVTPKPVSDCFKYAKEKGVYNLRQSTDPNGIYGFETIAFELSENLKNIDAVFIPVSSATTLVGIAAGFKILNKPVAVHAVQTEAVHPIAANFDKDFQIQEKSMADAIVAKYTKRQNEAVNYIRETQGGGWVISDEELVVADNWLKKRKIVCSFEGALALAGLFKAKSRELNYNNPVCILTGKKYA